MNAFAGIRPKWGGGGVETQPPSFFSLALVVEVICFPVGVQPPANFYPSIVYAIYTLIDCRFCIWNSIGPQHITSAPSLPVFCSRLRHSSSNP